MGHEMADLKRMTGCRDMEMCFVKMGAPTANEAKVQMMMMIGFAGNYFLSIFTYIKIKDI